MEALPQAGWLGRVIIVSARAFAVCILVAMAILVMEVFLRYVFNRPTIWAHETTIFLSAVTFIFGGLYCVARNTHIRVVLIYELVGQSVRHVLDVVISIACLGASLFFRVGIVADGEKGDVPPRWQLLSGDQRQCMEFASASAPEDVPAVCARHHERSVPDPDFQLRTQRKNAQKA